MEAQCAPFVRTSKAWIGAGNVDGSTLDEIVDGARCCGLLWVGMAPARAKSPHGPVLADNALTQREPLNGGLDTKVRTKPSSAGFGDAIDLEIFGAEQASRDTCFASQSGVQICAHHPLPHS